MHTCNLLIAMLYGSLLIHGILCIDEETQALIKEMADAMMACRNIVGMNLAIVQNGETSFTGGYGVTDLEMNDPVNPETIFSLASVTKQFSATALAVALEENGLTWNAKIRDVLGEDFYFSDGLRTSQATMKDLASHRLGIPGTDSIAGSDNYTRQHEAEVIRFVEPVQDFRESLLYNNNMYNIMGHITEVLTGRIWEDFIAERLFNPVNMTSTTFLHKADVSLPNFAKPYLTLGSGMPMRRIDDFINSNGVRGGAAASIASTAEDMAEWMKLQLNKGTLNGVRIIPEHIIQETHAGANLWPKRDMVDCFHQPTFPVTYVLDQYGLGFQSGWYRDYKMLSHYGDNVGYQSLLTLLPDMGIGLFTGTNGADSTSLGRRLFHSYVMDILLGFEPWLNTTTACTFPEPWVKESGNIRNTLSAFPEVPSTNRRNYPTDLHPYAGVFGNFYYGNFTMYVNDTVEMLMLHYGTSDPWSLVATGSEDVFTGIPSDRMWPIFLAEVTFAKSHPSENFDSVTFAFPGSAPATFIRGLNISDAPAPPDPNSCY